ncbi:MAG TPA: alpha/beta hydrolase, partial [Solirubrobacterales bacterium]|nr:alpha/beta hydrolase [Solirubrobacterales bacterium]
MDVVSLGDIDVAFRAAGSGERTLVMIHGLGQDHRMWAEIQDQLSEYRTIAYDLRGHGGSTVGDGAGSLNQLGGDLIALLERFGPAVLVGFSLGGSIALWAAAERPDLVQGVVAVATSSVVGRAAAAAIEERIETFEKGDAGEIYAQILEDTEAQLASGEADAAAVSAERAAAVRDPRGYVNAARAVRGMHEESLNARLTAIASPVLIVSG